MAISDTTRTTSNDTIEVRAARLVEQNVHLCLSSMVSTLANGVGGIDRASTGLNNLAEQAAELCFSRLDYEEAARQNGYTIKTFDTVERVCRDINKDGSYPTTSSRPWENACEDAGLDPYEWEVYEHWAVSTWLAEKLIEAGERVDTDFAGLNVWARTTTGQAISMDAVIEKIARSLMA